jgi:hypothetical protein
VQTRKRVLINAFTVRALRDGFPPARGAGKIWSIKLLHKGLWSLSSINLLVEDCLILSFYLL